MEALKLAASAAAGLARARFDLCAATWGRGRPPYSWARRPQGCAQGL